MLQTDSASLLMEGVNKMDLLPVFLITTIPSALIGIYLLIDSYRDKLYAKKHKNIRVVIDIERGQK